MSRLTMYCIILILIFVGQRVILADDSACLSVEFPMPFKEPLEFNMSEGVGPIRDESADLQVTFLQLLLGTNP